MNDERPFSGGMPAGRELDALVAEALGWKAYRERRGDYSLCVARRPGDREPWRGNRPPDPERYTEVSCVEAARIGFYGTGFPKFSEDIAAAWQAVETMGAAFDGLYPSRDEETGELYHWVAVTARGGDRRGHTAATPALAICRAALAACSTPPEKGRT